MTYNRLRFGTFIPPLHKIGGNPTLALHRDLEVIEHLDNLGFHEAWVGEHHSSGIENIGSPEVFLAAVAQRTRAIRLGTGGEMRFSPFEAISQRGDAQITWRHIMTASVQRLAFWRR